MCESPLEVGGVRYVCLEEGKRWHLSADSEARLYDLETREHHKIPFSLDLQFESLTPMVGVDGQASGDAATSESAATSQSTGKGHLEQAGRWSGWVEADGVRQNFGDSRAREPRQVVGAAALGWTEDVAMVFDQHFGRHPFRRHTNWHRRGRSPSRLGLAGRGTDEPKRMARANGDTGRRCDAEDLLRHSGRQKGREHELRADVMRVFPGGARPGETV